jgi:hypothetical protein
MRAVSADSLGKQLSVYPQFTDKELGLQCLFSYIQAAAQRYGVITSDGIDGDFAIAVQAQILRCEFEDCVDPRIARALYLVVSGEHARGGRLFRKYMHDGAMQLGTTRVAKEQHELRLKGPRAGGRATADPEKSPPTRYRLARDERIRKMYKAKRADGDSHNQALALIQDEIRKDESGDKISTKQLTRIINSK